MKLRTVVSIGAACFIILVFCLCLTVGSFQSMTLAVLAVLIILSAFGGKESEDRDSIITGAMVPGLGHYIIGHKKAGHCFLVIDMLLILLLLTPILSKSVDSSNFVFFLIFILGGYISAMMTSMVDANRICDDKYLGYGIKGLEIKHYGRAYLTAVLVPYITVIVLSLYGVSVGVGWNEFFTWVIFIWTAIVIIALSYLIRNRFFRKDVQ